MKLSQGNTVHHRNDFDGLPTILWQSEIEKHCQQHVYKMYGCLDHFAVNLILPNKQILNLCPNADYIRSYLALGISRYENALAPWNLNNYPVVPWRMLISEQPEDHYQELVSFKEGLHQLYSGMSFIHPVGDCYLNVAVASKSPDNKNALTLFSHAEEILNIGAFMLELFSKKLSEFYEYDVPSIEEIVLNDGHYAEIDRLSRDWKDLGIIAAYPLR